MKCTIEAFVAALGGKILESGMVWATQFEYKNWVFLVKKNEDTAFHFQVCQAKSNREASHYGSSELWKQLTSSINVSRSKTAERIAAEFDKRFEWSKLAEYKAQLTIEDLQYEESANDSENKFKALASILGYLRGIKDIELAKRLCTVVREHYENNRGK